MANYTGDPTATEAPSPPPTPAVAPILNMPVDGNPVNAATFAQPFKVLADFVAWAMKPRATLLSWAEEIAAWRNGRLQRRAGFDHLGFPGGLYRAWEEDWSDVAFSPQTTVSTGAWARRWNFQVGVTGGTLAGGGLTIQPPQFSGLTPIDPRSVLVQMNPFPNPAATAWVLVETAQPVVVITDDASLVMEWQGMPGGTCSAVGFSASSQIGLSAENTGLIGAAIMHRAADTNWQLYTNAGSSVFTDTGISLGSGTIRFRLEYHGANVSDSSASQVIAYLNGARVATVAVSLGSFAPLAFLRARSATNTTSPGNVDCSSSAPT